MERGHPVRLSAKREQRLNEDRMSLMSVLRTLADKDVRAPLTHRLTSYFEFASSLTIRHNAADNRQSREFSNR
jgi:hypothetical protein